MGHGDYISPAERLRVYDAFLRGRACISPKVEIPNRYPMPRLASVDAMRQHRKKGSWTHMLAEVAADSAMSPVAYLRHDGTVHGLVRDYSIEHVNWLSRLVGNGDMLIVTIHRTLAGDVERRKPTWMWGGREVTTRDYLTVSAPLMTQVYRLAKHPTPVVDPKKRAKIP